MTDFTIIARGPWRIHPSISEGKAAVSYRVEGRTDIVTVETHADLALLREAIGEYLEATR